MDLGRLPAVLGGLSGIFGSLEGVWSVVSWANIFKAITDGQRVVILGKIMHASRMWEYGSRKSRATLCLLCEIPTYTQGSKQM